MFMQMLSFIRWVDKRHGDTERVIYYTEITGIVVSLREVNEDGTRIYEQPSGWFKDCKSPTTEELSCLRMIDPVLYKQVEKILEYLGGT